MVSTHLKNISQIGSFPQVRVKTQNIRNPHLVVGFFESKLVFLIKKISLIQKQFLVSIFFQGQLDHQVGHHFDLLKGSFGDFVMSNVSN